MSHAMNSIHRSLNRWPLRLTLFAALAWLICFSVKPSAAQSLRGDLAAAAKVSVELLDTQRIPDLDQATAELDGAIEGLRRYLDRTTDSANANAWLKYLEIDSFTDAVDAGARDTQLALQAIRVVQKATGIHPGLETQAVGRLRQAASDYSDAIRFQRRDVTLNAIGRQLERVAQQWSSDESTLSPDEMATLRLLLDLLHRTGQSVPLVKVSGDRFAQPNLRVTVGESLISRSVNRTIREPSPVRDCILGTRVIGDALLTGNVQATLMPSVGTIRVRVMLSGNVSSNSIGYNGPVRVRTSGTGTAFASRIVEVDESGVRLSPITASGSMQNQINAIEHPLRIVRRIARKKAAQQKSQADRIANAKFIRRVSSGFDEETSGAVATPMPDWLGQLRPWLDRLDFVEPVRQIGSTEDWVYLQAKIGKTYQLASASPPPIIPRPGEVNVQLHESLINNTLGAVLAGRTMTQKELAELVGMAGRGTTAESVSKGDDESLPKPFEIDFDRSRPIVFEPRDGKLRVGIRGTRFAQGSRTIKRSLEVVATYRPIITDQGIVLLERLGDVEINFPGSRRLSTSQVGMRGAIKSGFADAFPKVLFDKPWKIPSTVKAEALAGLTYRAKYFDAQNDWLTIGASPVN